MMQYLFPIEVQRASISTEVIVKKCPGSKRGVDDDSVPFMCAVETGEQIKLTILVSLFASKIPELNPDALLT